MFFHRKHNARSCHLIGIRLIGHFDFCRIRKTRYTIPSIPISISGSLLIHRHPARHLATPTTALCSHGGPTAVCKILRATAVMVSLLTALFRSAESYAVSLASSSFLLSALLKKAGCIGQFGRRTLNLKCIHVCIGI